MSFDFGESWALFVEVVSWILIVGGAFFLFVGSLGMIRLQDFWARLHAASIIDSAGAGLLLFGMMLQTGVKSDHREAYHRRIVLLFLTGPTASHAVANAAFVSGSRPSDMVEDASEESHPADAETEPA